MARMAALSAAGSFAQAVTTWDKSCPALTRLCEALCEGETVLAASLLGSWRVRAPPLPPFVFLEFTNGFGLVGRLHPGVYDGFLSYTFPKSGAMNLRYFKSKTGRRCGIKRSSGKV